MGNASELEILAVAFDLDGTLFNTEIVYDMVGDALLNRRGHEMRPAVVANMMGRPAQVALQVMIDAYDLEDTVEQLKLESEEIFIDLLPGRADLMPGAKAMLDHVQSLGLPCAITTSSEPRLVTPLLEMKSITDRFQFVLTSADVTKHKPHPQIYHKAAELFGITPTQLLVFEDSQVGCAAAVASGACTVAIPSKHKGEQNYAGARMVVESMEDAAILELFKKA